MNGYFGSGVVGYEMQGKKKFWMIANLQGG
jgi:hypothetical protein